MDGHVDPTQWGPSQWDSMYHIAAGYFVGRREIYKAYFETIPYVLRCDECNMSMAMVMARRPPDDYLSTREKLLEWVWLTHMDVRRHQRVKTIPDFPLADVYKRYLPSDAQESAPTADEKMEYKYAEPERHENHLVSQQVAAPITIFATPKSHLGYSYGSPAATAAAAAPLVPATSFPHYPPGAQAPIALFAFDAAASGPARIIAQSIDGQVRTQVPQPAAGYKNLQVGGVSRCCKQRLQMAVGVGPSFVA